MINYRLYDFDDEEFSKLSFPVHKLDRRQNPLARFPVLNEFSEFHVKIPNVNRAVLMKYIVYLYDYRSPLRYKIENLQLRKYNAMHLAGVDPDAEGNYSDSINDILLNKNDAVLSMIFRYARLHRGSKYGFLVSLQEGYFIAQQQMATGDINSLDKLKRSQAEIEKITSDLLAEDNMGAIHNKFLDYVELENLGLKPEDIAKALKDGDDPLPGVNPYKRKKDEQKDQTTEIESKHREKLKVKYGLS